MIDAVKFQDTENNIKFTGEEKNFTFNVEELKFFTLEIKDMLIEGKEIDFGKAARNAKYLAMLDKGFKDMKAGKGIEMTFDELEKLIYE